MSYATSQDMVERYGEGEVIALTDRATPPTGAIDATVLGRGLHDADAEVNAYLGSRYDLPLVTVPPVLSRVACDIARYRLADNHDMVTDEIRSRYEDARRFLEALASGSATLGLPVTDAPVSIGGPRVAGPGRVFTQGTLEDF